MNPRDFCSEIVWPNSAELQSHWDDIRFAFNAVASVDALSGHIYQWRWENSPNFVRGYKKEDDSKYKKFLAEKNCDFRLIRDVAKLQKHAKTVRNPPPANHSDQIKSFPHGFSIELRSGEINENEVVVDLGPGKRSPALWAAVSGALEFLEDEMDQVGIPITSAHSAWSNRRLARIER